MGINLFDEYHRIMSKELVMVPLMEYYRDRTRLYEEVREICPYNLVHPNLCHPETQRSKDQIRWCDENLRGRYFASMEKVSEPNDEWIICFEFEDDAIAFKLMWK